MTLSSVTTDAPRNYITFDEAGATVTDTGAAPATLTVSGAVKAPGVSGTGMSYDGVNDYIATSAGVFDFSNLTAYTFEAWFKSSKTTEFPTIIRRDGGGRAILLRLNAGKVEWYCNTGPAISPNSYADDQWHHAVGVKNGTVTTLYVDGVQVATGAANTGAQGATAVYIGAGTAVDAPEFFSGVLDEVAIYNTALSSTRIQAHYNEGKALVGSTKVQPPAATLSLTAPVPVVYAGNVSNQMLYATSDRGYDSTADQNAGRISWGPSTYTAAYFKFTDVVIPNGKQIDTATLRLTYTPGSVTSGTVGYRIYRLTAPFVEGSYGAVSGVDTGITGTLSLDGADTAFDVSSMIQSWADGATNYGFELRYNSSLGTRTSGYGVISDRTSPTTERPMLSVVLEDVPPQPVTISAPVMTLSLTTPSVTARAQKNASSAASVATLDLTAIAPVIKAEGTAHNTVTGSMGSTITFVGGQSKNPDYAASAGYMEVWLFSPNADVTLEYPAVSMVSGAMSLSVTMPGIVAINLTTNKLSKVPPMTAQLKMVGIYFKEADRYLNMIKTTTDIYDVWLQMEEISGTVAYDALYDSVPTPDLWNNNGIYQAGGGEAVTLGHDGPRLRKGAARFDGITNYLQMNYEKTPSAADGTDDTIIDAQGPRSREAFDLTVEFSIRTADLDGVVFTGSGAQSGAAARLSMFATNGAYWTGHEVTIENGYLTFNAGLPFKTRVRQFISDGEWHHIIIGLPSVTAPKGPSYVLVDGVPTVRQVSGDLGTALNMIPFVFMARTGKGIVTSNTPRIPHDLNNMSGHLAGDLRDVIVRDTYVNMDTARHLYWEWSESVISTLDEPMTVSLSAYDPHKAVGNMMKMLCIFGLEQRFQYGGNSSTYEVYYSNLSGLSLAGALASETGASVTTSLHGPNLGYIERVPFRFEDYVVYPVSIEGAFERVTKTAASYGTTYGYDSSIWGPLGADGLLKLDGFTTDPRGFFVDDATGEKRWLNVNEDLALPLSEYDTITVMNYPWVEANQFWSAFATPLNPIGGKLRSQRNSRAGGDMTPGEWTKARDEFRDNLLTALYNGVNVWITEFHMAEHLGFIQGYDIHSNLNYLGRGGAEAEDGVVNVRALEIDRQHILNTPNYRHRGDYYSDPQALYYKRIVALEPGLTDMASYIPGETIVGWPYDDFDVTEDFVAADVINRPNGLLVGDKVFLNLATQYGAEPSWEYQSRALIASAKPQGIVGKVIAREQEFYYGPRSTEPIRNPWADNATTIIAERGTMLNGRPIGGRVLIELMGYGEFNRGFLIEDAYKDFWHGDSTLDGGPASTWSVDSRRLKKVLISTITEKLRFDKNTGSYTKSNLTELYIEFQEGAYLYKPYWPLGARGLHWLAQAGSLAPGAVRTFAQPMTVTVSTPAPGFSKTRNVGGTVNGAMRLDVELRTPPIAKGGNVSEKALPMVLNLEMKGTGKVVRVPAMTLTLSMPNTTITAGGDKITVYLEREETIKLFLKED